MTTITVLPILLGGGIPLFGSMGVEQRLRLVSFREYSNGLLQARYAV